MNKIETVKSVGFSFLMLAKHVEIRRYMNKIETATSVGFSFLMLKRCTVQKA